MDLSKRPAVVSNLTESANTPGAEPAAPTPATPTTASEATARGGNHQHYSITPIRHRGFDMLELEEEDGDGFTTPAYCAHRRGERPVQLSHPRFDFEPTQEWFASEVDALIARREAGEERIYRDGMGVMLCFALFSALAWAGSAMA